MCGRFACGRDPDDLAVAFGSVRAGEAVPPRWNIAPTDPVPIVLERAGRAKPAFRRAFRARRCLLPAYLVPAGRDRNDRNRRSRQEPALL